MSKKDKDAVDNFINYLKIKAVHPEPDYGESIRFLKEQAQELGLPCKVIEIVKNNPILVISWEGTNPNLPAVLLNSHTDVVPVFPEFWKYDPFSAHKDEKGDIYARGTQNQNQIMNINFHCISKLENIKFSINVSFMLNYLPLEEYIEAIRRLKAEGKRPLRSIHMSFVPDEEVGGHKGMELFVHHDEFKKLNIGFALDEGLANPTNAFTVFYGERCVHWVEVTCSGNPGHGSRFVVGDPGTKMRKVINSFMSFRDEQEEKFRSDPSLRLGDVTTTNLTCLSGGVQPNVIPAELKAVFDMRVTPTVDLAKLEQTIAQWCKDAGDGVTYKFLQVGLPAIGFSPMNNTPILLHDHNELLNEEVFVKGIPIYIEIIQSIANVPA
ncbi:hypothetical protein LSH36_18g09019 [Paralvinella palmiformis]|uniref:Peptidase M20 dimerisation domain-containing protein n=1 Tax=Paralvinella palmiformis TaxID=53620 RepID=A0AAD9KBV5_9ANNE|nr:hypothetical protein LSH36_18g09019 [Paralvinella palmiformis]